MSERHVPQHPDLPYRGIFTPRGIVCIECGLETLPTPAHILHVLGHTAPSGLTRMEKEVWILEEVKKHQAAMARAIERFEAEPPGGRLGDTKLAGN